MSGRRDFLTLDDFDVSGKTVLLRADFNSPVDEQTKKIIDNTRIREHAESTIKELVEKKARVVIMAHQGRPGDPDYTMLDQHARILNKILGKPVSYVNDVYGQKAKDAIRGMKDGDVLVLENVRSCPEEMEEKTPEEQAETPMVKELTPLADIYVNDAFAAAHRGHVSCVGFAHVLPSAAGRVMERELKALARGVKEPARPCVFLVAGAKPKGSFDVVGHVLDNGIADTVLTGGVTAQVFTMAKGIDLGGENIRFIEKKGFMEFLPLVKVILEKHPDKVLTPEDFAVDDHGKRSEVLLEALPTRYLIKDIGSGTIKSYTAVLHKAGTVVVNGPVGVFEEPAFIKGTEQLFKAIAVSNAFSMVGGGHTVAAVSKLGLSDRISYVSTAGGALIEFLTGKKLPAVEALREAASRR